MSEDLEVIELEVTPFSSNTFDSLEKEFIPFLENMLQKTDVGQFYADGQIKISPPKTFPEKNALYIVVYFLSKTAYETWMSCWKEIFLQKLKEHWGIRTRTRSQSKAKNDNGKAKKKQPNR